MPSYCYKSLDKQGQELSGKLDAEGLEQAITILRKQGLYPTHIRLESEAAFGEVSTDAAEDGEDSQEWKDLEAAAGSALDADDLVSAEARIESYLAAHPTPAAYGVAFTLYDLHQQHVLALKLYEKAKSCFQGSEWDAFLGELGEEIDVQELRELAQEQETGKGRKRASTVVTCVWQYLLSAIAIGCLIGFEYGWKRGVVAGGIGGIILVCVMRKVR